MLKLEYCRERQKRLLKAMEGGKLDLVVLGNPKTVFYFTGALVDPSLPQAFAVTASGKSLLVTNQAPREAAADRVETYTAYTIARAFNRTTMNAELAAFVRDFAAGAPGAVGVELEFVNAGLMQVLEGRPVSNVSPVLNHMRRRKDPDELESIRASIALTEAGYSAVKTRLEPGMTEYDAHLVMYEAMVRLAETSVDLRGDFACGARAINGGGPPVNRKVQAGDLYIFDIFPLYQGYMCDLCRTFSASAPSALQLEAWAHVMEGLKLAEKLIRPGVPARSVYDQVRSHLDSFALTKGSFNHHLGHGVGMDGWEDPWMNAGTDQVIEEGDVLACEPGLYGEALGGGIRLEHNYLVGSDGVTPLDTFPMDLR